MVLAVSNYGEERLMSTTIGRIRGLFGANDEGPLVTAEQLSKELLRTTIIVMIVIGIPYHILVILSVANGVWGTHLSPPITFLVQVVGSILTLTVPAFLVKRSPMLALNVTVGISFVLIYVQLVITDNPSLIGAIISVLALPSLVTSWKYITKIMIIFTIGFLVVLKIDPAIAIGKNWVLSIVTLWPIMISFMILGIGFQHVIANYTHAVKQQQSEIDARRIAETANQHKSQFLAHMSHELRTPLQSILGFSEMILIDKKDPINDKKREVVQDILDEGEHLLQLINDVLDLSRIEAGKLEIFQEAIDVENILQRVKQTMSKQILQKGLQLTINNHLRRAVWADEIRLRQILLNLVSNAVKFTQHGSIIIEVSEHNTMAIFKVCDTGIGIPAEYLESVFETFQQVQGSFQREFSGSGLGLPITKQLIEKHGGQIWVVSEEHKGSEFSFSIPFAESL
jgi:signal transduction histidine kinase